MRAPSSNALLFPTLAFLLPFALQSCGSVAIAEENYYRLELDSIDLGFARNVRHGVLRVANFSVSPHLGGDRLVTMASGNRVAPYRYHHWVAPLDQLVTDAVFRSLLAARRFESVIDSRDSANADWVLTARILEFEELAIDQKWGALVSLALTIREERSGRTLWQKQLEQFVPLESSKPLAVVKALNKGLGLVLKEFASHVDARRELIDLRAAPGK